MTKTDVFLSKGLSFILLARGLKLITANAEARLPKGLLNLLVSGHRAWNIEHFQSISDYLRIEPDELLKTGRILAGLPDGMPGRPELEGLRAGSFERFSLIYNACAGGTLMAAHYPANVIWARVPGAASAYGKGKITDAQMRAACASLVRRVLAAPDSDIWAVFGLLD